MKKLLTAISLFILSGVICDAQTEEIREFYNSTVSPDKDLPTLVQGYETQLFVERKGKRALTLQVLNIEYADSSYNQCTAKTRIRLSAKGKSYTNSLYQDRYSQYFFIYRRDLAENLVINENESIEVEVDILYKSYEDQNISISNANAKRKAFLYIPPYDGSVYSAKEEARIERQRRERKEAEERAAIMRAKEDSLRNAYRERQNMLLTPEYLANWVGADFFTKESIEKDCNVYPAAYNGGYIMYDFSKCPVTMEFDDASGVCTEISFSLFGEDGYRMKRDLINYGYKLQSRTTGDLIIENNLQNVQTGTSSIYKCKLKNGGYSTCRITEGQAMMFTFRRTKK